MSRKQDQANAPEDTDSLSRDASAGQYRSRRRQRGAKRVIKIVLVTVLVVVAVAAGSAFAYVHLINSQINSGMSDELKDSLATTESGKPFYMLLLGTDRDEERADSSDFGSDDSAYRSDSIMVARIDPENKKACLVSIHRDTLVDMGKNGRQKINAAYSLGGPSYATEVISTFAGVPIAHYAEIDMDGLAAIIDKVGGIDINLPMDVKDPHYTGLDLTAGQQHLDGTTAALLCRARHAYDSYGDGDRFRAANQRIVIEAVLQKVLSSDVVTMASTVQTLAGYVRTDMTVESIVSLARQFVGMNVDTDITSAMEPTTSLYEDGVWYEICDVPTWRTMMERVDQGLSPTESGKDDATAGVTAQTQTDTSTGTADSAEGAEGTSASGSSATSGSGSASADGASSATGSGSGAATAGSNAGTPGSAGSSSSGSSSTSNSSGSRSGASSSAGRRGTSGSTASSSSATSRAA